MMESFSERADLSSEFSCRRESSSSLFGGVEDEEFPFVAARVGSGAGVAATGGGGGVI